MKRHHFSCSVTVVVLLLQGATASSAQQATAQSRTAVLTGASGQTLFKQCSRTSPSNASVSWVPNAQDIKALEERFPAFLRSQKLMHRLTATILIGYYRQCVGFDRGGHRFIYINAFAPNIKAEMERPTEHRKPFDWHRDPVMVCDGGDAFFGVEYDVETKQFRELHFNGR